jgi:hypothetical protein
MLFWGVTPGPEDVQIDSQHVKKVMLSFESDKKVLKKSGTCTLVLKLKTSKIQILFMKKMHYDTGAVGYQKTFFAFLYDLEKLHKQYDKSRKSKKKESPTSFNDTMLLCRKETEERLKKKLELKRLNEEEKTVNTELTKLLHTHYLIETGIYVKRTQT